MTDPLLIAVDANNLLYADFKATEEGDPSGQKAAQTFVNRLDDALEMWHPNNVLIAFDHKESERRKRFPAYKEGRPSKPDGLINAMTDIWHLMEQRGICRHAASGWEADDVIASAVTQHKGRTVIMSRDKDMKQLLVDKRVMILKSYSVAFKTRERFAEWYKHANLVEDCGIIPSQFVDYQCLVGDDADNVKGAGGFGPKRATAFLYNKGTLTGIDETWATVELDGKPLTPKQTVRILDLVTRLEEVKFLLTLKRDLPIPDTTWKGTK